MRGVGLRRGGKQNHGVCKRQPRFRHSEILCGLTARAGDCGGKRVGESDILGGDDLQAAAGGEQFACGQEFGKVKDCRVGIRAADGFLQAGEQVVVDVVGKSRSLRVEGFDVGFGQLILGGVVGVLKEDDGMADVALRKLSDFCQKCVVCGFMLSRFVVEVIQCAAQDGDDRLSAHGFELKDRAPRQERFIHAEVGVIGC